MDLKLDSTGDLAIENNDLVWVDGLDAIVQDLDNSLKLFAEEWFLDKRWGFPYYKDLLGKKVKENVIKSLYREAILKVNGIVTVFDLDVSFEATTRILTVSFRASSIEGEFEYTREFIL